MNEEIKFVLAAMAYYVSAAIIAAMMLSLLDLFR